MLVPSSRIRNCDGLVTPQPNVPLHSPLCHSHTVCDIQSNAFALLYNGVYGLEGDPAHKVIL